MFNIQIYYRTKCIDKWEYKPLKDETLFLFKGALRTAQKTVHLGYNNQSDTAVQFALEQTMKAQKEI